MAKSAAPALEASDFQRRLKRLFELIETGKLRFIEDQVPETVAALKRVKRLPDGTFNLSTVDGPVRALCMTVDFVEYRANPQFDHATMDLPPLSLPRLDALRTSDNAFLTDLIDASNLVRKYMMMVASVIPDASIDSARYAILAGHAVRLFKLYDTFLYLIVAHRSEMAMIQLRALAETAINFAFLLNNNDPNLIRSFHKASLAYEKKLWDEVEQRRQTPPLPIEQRMQDGAKRAILRAGFKLEEISWSDRNWGGDVFGKARTTDLISLYEFAFRPMSHNVHGTWHDLEFHHLEHKDGQYHPCLHYTDAQPQLIEGATVVCLGLVRLYVQVVASGQSLEISLRLQDLEEWFRQMSSLHETFVTASKGNESAQATDDEAPGVGNST